MKIDMGRPERELNSNHKGSGEPQDFGYFYILSRKTLGRPLGLEDNRAGVWARDLDIGQTISDGWRRTSASGIRHQEIQQDPHEIPPLHLLGIGGGHIEYHAQS